MPSTILPRMCSGFFCSADLGLVHLSLPLNQLRGQVLDPHRERVRRGDVQAARSRRTVGDLEKASTCLRPEGAKADKRAGASVEDSSDVPHHDGKIGLSEHCERTSGSHRDFKAARPRPAVHIAATNPLAVRIEDLPAELISTGAKGVRAQVASRRNRAHPRKIVDA